MYEFRDNNKNTKNAIEFAKFNDKGTHPQINNNFIFYYKNNVCLSENGIFTDSFRDNSKAALYDPEHRIVFDTEENAWHEWTSTTQNPGAGGTCGPEIDGCVINGPTINGDGLTTGFPFITTEFKWKYATDSRSALSGKLFLLHATEGKVALLDVNAYKDCDEIIRCEYYTPLYDMDSYHRKFMQRINVIADQTNNMLFFRWSDNDYISWSKYRSASLRYRPVYHRLGTFRRRAFNFYFTDNAPLRIRGIEVIYSESDV